VPAGDAGAALAGPALLPLLSTADYRAEPAVFALLGLSVAAFGLYQILLYTLLLDGRSRQVLGLAVAAAALNAALNCCWRRAGCGGAATAAAASNAAMVVWAARLAQGVMTWRFPWAGLGHISWRALAAALPLAAVLWPWRAAAAFRGRWCPSRCCWARSCIWRWTGRAGSVARMLLAR